MGRLTNLLAATMLTLSPVHAESLDLAHQVVAPKRMRYESVTATGIQTIEVDVIESAPRTPYTTPEGTPVTGSLYGRFPGINVDDLTPQGRQLWSDFDRQERSDLMGRINRDRHRLRRLRQDHRRGDVYEFIRQNPPTFR